MVKNIIFDIGNVILKFDIKEVLENFTSNPREREFIFNNVFNSPEWIQNNLVDTGFISIDEAIIIQQDRTNHQNDELISRFWHSYLDYAVMNQEILDIIYKLRQDNYKVYILSNINTYMYNYILKYNLLDLVDGYVLSFQEHMLKPYQAIYNLLIDKYQLNPSDTLYLDDNQKNIDMGNKIGLISEKVIPDNIESVKETLNKYLNLFK